jgi:hypothetical protein
MKTEIQTFKKLGDYDISNLTKDNPTCFNGNASIIKYKITIEEIQEPKEIYIDRINELWENCDNHHHWKPLRDLAKKYGHELDTKNVGKNLKSKQ